MGGEGGRGRVLLGGKRLDEGKGFLSIEQSKGWRRCGLAGEGFVTGWGQWAERRGGEGAWRVRRAGYM